MNINPRGVLRPVRNDRESNPDQEEDSPSRIIYAVYPYYSNVNMSLRYAAKSLRSVIVRSYTSIWRWVQRLGGKEHASPLILSITPDTKLSEFIEFPFLDVIFLSVEPL